MSMEFVRNFPLFSIILALFSGVACTLLSGKAARNLILGVVTLIGAMSTAVMVYVIDLGTYYIYLMGHFPAPWGNEIRVGRVEAILAVVFSVVMILSLLGGMKHIFEDVEDEKVNLYFLMISLLFASMLALIYTNDLFTGYVFVEINTIAACAIVMLRDSKETLVATARYLALSLLGSGMFLLGICILYDITGHLLMENISEAIMSLVVTGKYAFPLEMVIALFCVGLATKSALFPFHTWLPGAHGTATSASSAILSGLVLKGYIILLIKIIYRVIGFEVFKASKAIHVLFFLGACAMVAGSALALTEKNMKRMIAYSSVAQVGYIYLAIGTGTIYGMVAAVYQIIAHALTKPMLFDAAGGLMEVSSGRRSFDALKGSGRRNLLAGIAFVTGALSMIGIPLFAGFMTKYYLATAGLLSGWKMIPTLAVLAVSTVLNAMYYIPAVMVIFSGPDSIRFVPEKKNVAFIFAMIAFIVLNIVLGCFSGPMMNVIRSSLLIFS